MRIVTWSFLLVIVICLFSFNKQSFFTVPKGWKQPVYDFSSNPLSAEKIHLGRMLFYDPLLSRDSSISCAGCHSPYAAFAHTDHDLSHGIEDRIGKRNAPALMNLAWQPVFMWDGAIHHLDAQPLAPISNEDEMGSNIKTVVEKLNRSQRYKLQFFRAFGDSLATGEKILKAMSQFMLVLVSANSKYDQAFRGEVKLSDQEYSGYQLFTKYCSSCHSEPLFTTHQFADNGLPIDTTLMDVGRMKITKDSSDYLQFKIPTLRNIAYTYPYMHDGRFKKLKQVMKHYTSGIEHRASLHPNLKEKILLSENEQLDVIAFLKTLSDSSFVFNPAFSFLK
jgi:cytochrome c peroxidase